MTTSFTVLTDTPARLRTFLINRGVMQLADDGQGGQVLTGTRPGMEFVEVPNPITIDGVQDTRRTFMVKFAHEAEGEKADNFRDWITSNSSPVTAPANYLIHGEPVGGALKITGENVWLIRDQPERFGVWQ